MLLFHSSAGRYVFRFPFRHGAPQAMLSSGIARASKEPITLQRCYALSRTRISRTVEEPTLSRMVGCTKCGYRPAVPGSPYCSEQ